MGLDMYLNKRVYIGAQYAHNNVTGTISLKDRNGKRFPIDRRKVSEVIEAACYWRKANMIHAWFVQNVQNGEDDCGTYDVSGDQLAELRDLCKKALKTRDASLLPPRTGFFFGSTEIDDFYWQDLEDTVRQLEALDLENGDYQYHSSW